MLQYLTKKRKDFVEVEEEKLNEIEVLANDEELKSQSMNKTLDLIEIESENEQDSLDQLDQTDQPAAETEQTMRPIIPSRPIIQDAQASEEMIQVEIGDYNLTEQRQRSISDSEIENCVANLNEETDRLIREKRNIDRLTGTIEKCILDDAKVR
jgi:hypothetical protein